MRKVRETMQQSMIQQLDALGIDTCKGINEWGEDLYYEKLKSHITGYDFLKLGQSINRGQWESAHMTLRRMSKTNQELGLFCMTRWYGGLREALAGRDIQSAKLILAQMTQKRLQIRKLIY